MRRLAWTFAARIGYKYQIRLTRSNYCPLNWFWCKSLEIYLWVSSFFVLIRQKKNKCVFPISAPKKLDMLGWFNFILFWYCICILDFAPHFPLNLRSILVSDCLCVHASVCPFVTLFDACHILWTVLARVLKFHIISHGKIAGRRFFSCPSYLPFWSYALLKKSVWNIVSKNLEKYLS